ncbi:MAG TPA: CoA transferase [Anaerolineales bacterium]|nr:CoA transferase [Anaerolineales bacterium]
MQPLNGIRVLDLSRVLAGPYCTMVLGDLGADVIKIELSEGDETRGWGPPFAGKDDRESAYYLCVNRNKRGMVVDFKTDEGRAIILELAKRSDVLVENFRPKTLSRFSLDFESVSAINPQLIYCSITGFGQTGPLRDRPGYDFMIQAMGGLMSITGEPDGEPMKVGVAVADLFAGQNAVIAILAALQARTQTGKGQHIDISLFDSQLGMLANVASNFLISGNLPKRYGNAHANIVPYQSFQANDAWFVVAVGNDRQFEKLCEVIGSTGMLRDYSGLVNDVRFRSNSERVKNRAELIDLLKPIFLQKTAREWLSTLEDAGIPCGPINTLDQVFAIPQVEAREMLISMEHQEIGDLRLVGSPLKFSDTPVNYHLPPPMLGEHTEEVLKELLGYSSEQLIDLRERGVI